MQHSHCSGTIGQGQHSSVAITNIRFYQKLNAAVFAGYLKNRLCVISVDKVFVIVLAARAYRFCIRAHKASRVNTSQKIFFYGKSQIIDTHI